MQLILTGAAYPLTICCPGSFTFAQLADTVATKLDGRHDMVKGFSFDQQVLSPKLCVSTVLLVCLVSLQAQVQVR